MLVEPQFSVFRLKYFVHFGYRKCLSFHSMHNLDFFGHFLQISHNLRIINGQNNMSDGETRKLDIPAKLFQAGV